MTLSHEQQQTASPRLQQSPSEQQQQQQPKQQRRCRILVLLTIALLSISSYASHMILSRGVVHATLSIHEVLLKHASSTTKKGTVVSFNERSSSWDDDDDGSRDEIPMTSSSSMSQQQTQSNGKGNNSIEKHGQEEEEENYRSEIAWIMSFGGSGTSYTVLNVEQMTNTSTATNYAESLEYCIPLNSHDNLQYDGPCLRHAHGTTSNGSRPPRFVLTKTHCGGYCMDCAPREFVHNASSFERACRSGNRPRRNQENNTVLVEPFTYAANVTPKRIVHLIRNPFNNLIGRMHLAVKRRRRQQGDEGEERAQQAELFVDSRDGLAAWCRHLDAKYLSREQKYFRSKSSSRSSSSSKNTTDPLSSTTWLEKYGTTVPCHTEWFRYIQWHNRAVEVTANMQQPQQQVNKNATDAAALPVYYLYYENYTHNYNATVHQLLDFLQLDAIQAPKPFFSGKSYMDFFDSHHIQAATRMVHDLSSLTTWRLIRHYFDETHIASIVDSSTHTDDEEFIADGGSASFLSTRVANGTPNRGSSSPDKPDVVWLMSFPNSGTSYTISNTERVTNHSTASNYAGDWLDYVPPAAAAAARSSGHMHAQHLGYDGPFVHKPALGLPPTSLLTKTHCGGYCDDCRPSGYVVESAQAFQEACCRGELMLPNGNRTSTEYSPQVVRKAVHLIRSPYNNLIARLHLAVKRRKRLGMLDNETLAQFSHSRTGYLAWCNYVDTKHATFLEKTKLISSETKALMKGLPCHGDWFRYVQWHNRAIEVTQQLQIPVHYLYYEDYSAHYNETLHGLLDFLELLPPTNEPLAFISGKTYLDLYSAQEIQVASRFVRAMATPDCWNVLKRYFGNEEQSWH